MDKQIEHVKQLCLEAGRSSVRTLHATHSFEKSISVKVLLNKTGQMYLRIASGTLAGKQNTLVGVRGIGVEVFFVTDEELERQFSSEAEIDPALAARALLRIGTRSKITSEARESLEWIAA